MKNLYFQDNFVIVRHIRSL